MRKYHKPCPALIVSSHAVMKPLSVNIFPNNLAPKVTNSIPKNASF